MEKKNITPTQLLLIWINKFLNIVALLVVIFVIALNLGYPAYVLFVFLILLHSILLLWTINEERKERRKTGVLYLILFLTVIPYLVLLFYI
ncbi:MAG: hypothetical protein H7Y00_12760 [Fimbriimonadaceae bacterium]|nr:hypothetical protein [Chitinophagales bacterium]